MDLGDADTQGDALGAVALGGEIDEPAEGDDAAVGVDVRRAPAGSGSSDQTHARGARGCSDPTVGETGLDRRDATIFSRVEL